MRKAVQAVGGRVALIPWVMFVVTALLTAIGAASPAACAIIGPIALGFAGRYRINPLLMGMFVVHGAQAGGFSPISIYGTITNSVMRDNDLPVGEITVFLTSLVVNLLIAVVLFFVLGGRDLASRRIDADEIDDTEPADGRAPPRRRTATAPRSAPATPPTGAARWAPRPADDRRAQGGPDQVVTLVAFVAVAVVALVFDKNIGFTAITAAVILTALFPKRAEGRRRADRLGHRPAGRRGQHVRGDPETRRARRSTSASGPPGSARPSSAR